MKIIIVTFALILMALVKVNAQTVTTDVNGNFVAVKTNRVKADAKETGKTYTDNKGNIYPVMVSVSGKLFVIKTSKNTGNEYRMYLKIENANTNENTPTNLNLKK